MLKFSTHTSSYSQNRNVRILLTAKHVCNHNFVLLLDKKYRFHINSSIFLKISLKFTVKYEQFTDFFGKIGWIRRKISKKAVCLIRTFVVVVVFFLLEFVNVKISCSWQARREQRQWKCSQRALRMAWLLHHKRDDFAVKFIWMKMFLNGIFFRKFFFTLNRATNCELIAKLQEFSVSLSLLCALKKITMNFYQFDHGTFDGTFSTN